MLRTYHHYHLRKEHKHERCSMLKSRKYAYLMSEYEIDSMVFVHPCCTSVSRMILKMDRDYSFTNNKLGLDIISPAQSIIFPKCLRFTHTPKLVTAKENNTFLHIRLFFFSCPKEELRVLFIKS